METTLTQPLAVHVLQQLVDHHHLSPVRDNYYCESGTVTTALPDVYYVDDPVWDGQDCPSDNSCCSQPSLPWFYRQLPRAASEDIEARLCRDEDSVFEDILVKEFQLYVQ